LELTAVARDVSDGNDHCAINADGIEVEAINAAMKYVRSFISFSLDTVKRTVMLWPDR
jgi:hypothetical protein